MANPIISQIEVDGILYDISVQLAQTVGSSATRAMSQRATTANLDNILSAFETEGGTNMVDPLNFEYGFYNGSVGDTILPVPPSESTSHMRTIEPIDITDVDVLHVSTSMSNPAAGNFVSLYYMDASGKILKQASTTWDKLLWNSSSPAGAKKLHMWISRTDNGYLPEKLCVSPSNTNYEPYGALKVIKHLKFGKIPLDFIVQTTGTSTSRVMSQSAVTQQLENVANMILSKIPYDVLESDTDYANETSVTFPYLNQQIASNGALVSADNYAVSEYIDIKDIAQIYRYGTTTKWNLYPYAFYDADKAFLEYHGLTTDYTFETINGIGGATQIDLTVIPSNARFIRISKSLRTEQDVYTYMLVPKLYTYKLNTANISTPQIRAFAKALDLKIPFDFIEVVDGYELEYSLSFVNKKQQVASNGAVVASNNWDTTDFIDISNVSIIYRFGSDAKYAGPMYALYDKAQKFLSFVDIRTNYEFETINGHTYCLAIRVDNPDAKYMRISQRNDQPEYTYNVVPYKTNYNLYDSDIVTPIIRKLSKLISMDYAIREKFLADKTIVTMGDSIFGNNDTDTGVTNQMAQRLGATLINCAFGGTRMSQRTQVSGYEAFDFPALARAIAAGDYMPQETALENYSLPSYYASRLQRLKEVDWSKVDIITFNHGTNDYTSSVDIQKYKDAMIECISTIATIYPQIRFVAISPTWRFWYVDGEYSDDSDTHMYNGNTLPDICTAMREVAQNQLHIPFIDAYNVGINKYNYSRYFSATDGTHQAENGRILLASYLSKQLMNV